MSAKSLGISKRKKKPRKGPVPFHSSPLAKRGVFGNTRHLYYFDQTGRFMCSRMLPSDLPSTIVVQNLKELRLYLELLPNLMRRFPNRSVRIDLLSPIFDLVARTPGAKKRLIPRDKPDGLGARFRSGQCVL